MAQKQWPEFPDELTPINADLAVQRVDERVVYFHRQLPIFSHEARDLDTFRLITSQFCVDGSAKQVEIVRTFGVSAISVKRGVKRYREAGPAGFYAPRRQRGAAVLTAAVLSEAQALFDEGMVVAEVAERLGLKANTVAKAVRAGRLHQAVKKSLASAEEPAALSTKSTRRGEDSVAAMGMGATNSVARVAASTGQSGPVEVHFAPAQDVPHGGVLLALPALLVSGLRRHVASYFQLPRGYYALPSVFLLLAFMALARLKSPEDLRYCAPGEWGKLLGLDRIPEVRTVRTKLAHLAEHGQPAAWSAQLCRDWLQADPAPASVLYVDGHVRVYNGHQTALPRHYVARQKLCLRATTDYWVNAMDGQPFCLLNKAVDPGLIQVLETELIPRLEQDIPVLASAEQLAEDPWCHRFTLVFDREGYSPALFQRLKQQRIACLSYHKYPGEDWPLEEFSPRQVTLASGQSVTLRLAERGTFLGGKLWVRELRKLTDSGHQTAILATDYCSDLAPLATAMFARWSQENFFRYRRQHYHLDRLVDYQTEPLPDTTPVVNPAYRELDKQIRRTPATLNRRLAQFGTLALATEPAPEATNTTPNATKASKTTPPDPAQLQADIVQLPHTVATDKAERQTLERHITAAELPENAQFSRLSTDRKHRMDTLKMIAYRAETAMAQCLRETMARHDDARSLLRALYNTEADLLPDEQNATLTVRLHHLANHSADDAIRHLCAELNATETIFPDTNLRLVYELVSTRNP